MENVLTVHKARKRPRMNHHTITLDRSRQTMLIVKDKGNKPDITYNFEDLRGILKSWDNATVVTVLTPKGSKEGKNKVVSAMISMGRWKKNIANTVSKGTAGARGWVNRATSKSQGVRMGTHAMSSVFGGSYFADRFSDMVHKYDLEFENVQSAQAFYLHCRWISLAVCGDPFVDEPLTRPAVTPMKVFVGTWNLGNAAPPGSLDAWIPKDAGYDIIAVGSQESQYAPRPPYTTCEADWFDQVVKHLGDGYVKVDSLSLWEIRLIVFVAIHHFGRVSNVARSSEGVGIGKMLGNKGGVAIAMQVDSTSLCFVTSHLAAHQDKVSKRNEDASSIISNVKLGNPAFDLTSQFDYLFWSGDLNYRIDLTVEQTRKLIDSNNLEELRKFDQLKVEVDGRRVFFGFTEAPLTFPPTYKYSVGVWDDEAKKREYSDEKSRVPSWCDRVLVSSFPNSPFRSHLYTSCDEVTTSDHSPVAAGFDIMVRHAALPRAQQPRGARIEITNLRCSELVVPATLKSAPDTYLRFSGWYLDKDVDTSPAAPVIAGEGWDNYYSASWNLNVSVYPEISDHLLNEVLVVSLGRVRKDESKGIDALGYAILALKDFGSGEPCSVEVPLISSGLRKGTLSATIQLFIPGDALRDEPVKMSSAPRPIKKEPAVIDDGAAPSSQTSTNPDQPSPERATPPPLPPRKHSRASPAPKPVTPPPAIANDLIDLSSPSPARSTEPTEATGQGAAIAPINLLDLTVPAAPSSEPQPTPSTWEAFPDPRAQSTGSVPPPVQTAIPPHSAPVAYGQQPPTPTTSSSNPFAQSTPAFHQPPMSQPQQQQPMAQPQQQMFAQGGHAGGFAPMQGQNQMQGQFVQQQQPQQQFTNMGQAQPFAQTMPVQQAQTTQQPMAQHYNVNAQQQQQQQWSAPPQQQFQPQTAPQTLAYAQEQPQVPQASRPADQGADTRPRTQSGGFSSNNPFAM